MSLKFNVGDLTIHRIIEQETTFLPALEMLPGLTPELLAENRAWMREAGALDDKDVLILCFQSYVVKTPHHTILIDSCIGNDKPRPQRPKWNMKTDDTYARALATAGITVGDIDYVMCTHLHVDHVGWNTRLDNGRWVPTFPKARYVFEKTEFDYWTETHAKTPVPPFGDSVLPVVEAKQAEIVRSDYQIGDHTRILPTPGHTPGHAAFTFGRGKDDAVFSGDLMHSPLQTRYPGIVDQVRCRSGAGGDDAARVPGAILRHRYAVLHRAFSLAFGRKDPTQGQWIFLRGDMSANRPTFETLSVEPVDEHVTIVRLNRPDASNALNTQMGRDLVRWFEDAALDPKSLRCIVLTGTGDKAFCAGGDLKERRGMTDEAWTRQHVIFERMVRALIDCPVPIIGAVNGAAYGGGCEIAGACDFLYAAEGARFALTEVTLGIMPGGGGTQTLPRAVGERRAKELILTGKPFTAAEAHTWGLVNEVFPLSELLPAALATAARIARNAPISVRQAKLSIHRGLQLSLRDGLALEIEAYNRMVPTEDRREGVLAFNEKRTPNFKGR